MLVPWIPAVLTALCAGVLDWRYRRIPNWLTVSGLVAGIAANGWLFGWTGIKNALLGGALGLLLLLPFVLLRSLGAGDWKLAGAFRRMPRPRTTGYRPDGNGSGGRVMALAVVIWKGRLLATLRNIVRILAALFHLRMPGSEVSLDSPQSTKIPFGVAMAFTVLWLGVWKATGKL